MRVRLSAAVWARSLPRAADAYPAAASLFPAEHLLDLGATHPVEVVRNRELSGEKAEPANLISRRGIQRSDLDQRLACLFTVKQGWTGLNSAARRPLIRILCCVAPSVPLLITSRRGTSREHRWGTVKKNRCCRLTACREKRLQESDRKSATYSRNPHLRERTPAARSRTCRRSCVSTWR